MLTSAPNTAALIIEWSSRAVIIAPFQVDWGAGVFDLITTLNDLVWSSALVYLCLGAGLYFTLRTRFVQFRTLRLMVRSLRTSHESHAGVSSFQALAISLSGRVGTGNIAGVATAIAFGGPGAVFWMWVVALLGASTSFIECTLGQIYKEKDPRGEYRGGPAFYIEKALGWKWYAWIFAIATVVATGLLLPGVQANAMVAAVNGAFGIDPAVVAAIVVALLAFIIFGGVKRIAHFSQLVVPFMAIGYVLTAVVVLALEAERIPDMFMLVFKSAFGMEAGFGAVFGSAIQWGVKRGIYSNEAGQGTGPHPAAAAEVDHPARQGFVQAFSIYVDTLFICTATALMILSTGMYNVVAPDGSFLVHGLPGVEAGPAFTQAAIDAAANGLGSPLVAVTLCFFSFTTLVAYYYIAETNVAWINRSVHRTWLVFALKVGMLVAVGHGAMQTASLAWALGDLGVGIMAWLNLIAILLIQRPALAALRDFETQIASTTRPVFDPAALGIQNAELWYEIERAPVRVNN